MEISKTFGFDAAHHRPNVPAGHKCGRLHGHSFQVEVFLTGEPDPQTGWIVDFGQIGCVVRPVLDQIDHTYLNEIDGLENPTSENIARWIWTRLKPRLPQLTQLVVRESATAACIYRGQ
jgi:6-pyruvoyltetrahydropterin/6-carboxytetrahydropterin synthase